MATIRVLLVDDVWFLISLRMLAAQTGSDSGERRKGALFPAWANSLTL
jgi:hypothetical protein